MDKMNFHIITILGISGLTKDEQGQEVPAKRAFYEIDKSLEKLPLKAGEFHNVTHFLFESFEGEKFDFIATSEALKTQKKLFNEVENAKFSQHLNEVKTLSNEDEFEDIFSQTLNFIKDSESKNIILDITHGLRHQPIIASFASVLGRVNEGKNIQIIFAKELIKNTKYSFISLDKYLEISLVAIALNDFTNSLSVARTGLNEPFIKHLSEFSKALFANAMVQMFDALDKALFEFSLARRKFSSLGAIFDDIKSEILDELNAAKNEKIAYKRYYLIANFMFKKQFFLNSATLISEAIGLYLVDKFTQKGFMKKCSDDYKTTNEAKNFVLFSGKINKIKDEKFTTFINFSTLKVKVKAKQGDFNYLRNLIFKISVLRNDLVHLNKESDRSVNKIKNELSQVLNNFSDKCLKNDCLKDL